MQTQEIFMDHPELTGIIEPHSHVAALVLAAIPKPYKTLFTRTEVPLRYPATRLHHLWRFG